MRSDFRDYDVAHTWSLQRLQFCPAWIEGRGVKKGPTKLGTPVNSKCDVNLRMGNFSSLYWQHKNLFVACMQSAVHTR